MVCFAKIVVELLDGSAIAYPNATLKEVATKCLDEIAEKEPLLIVPNAETKLYFHKNHFSDWLQNEIDSNTLFNLVKVDDLVRNKEEIINKKNSIEAGSLWLLKGKNCILANDDLFVSETFNERFKFVI